MSNGIVEVQECAAMDQDKTKDQLLEELTDLRRREAHWRSIVANTPLFVALVDRAGTIQYLNHPAAGHALENTIGTSAYDFIEPGYRRIARDCVERVFDTGKTAFYEAVAAGPNGSLSSYETYVGPVKVGDHVVAVTLVSNDITQRKQAEGALRESEDRFRKVFEEGPLGILLVGTDGGIQHTNQHFCDMLGYSENEIIALGLTGISHPDDWARDRPAISRLWRGEISCYHVEKRYLRKDGQVLWAQLTVSLMHDEAGRPINTVGMVTDITERKQAEEALQKAHDELKQRVKEARLNETRLEAVLQLSRMAEACLKEITDFALEQAVALTESKIGYVAFMNEDETVLTMHSWSREAMAECAISDKPLVYPVVTTGLWGEAARQRKPIVTNDYPAPNPLKKGIPEGHVGLRRHMNVPIIDEGRIVIVAGVGNKEEEYNESDIRQLTLLMTNMWTLIQRNGMHAELRQHRDHLEQLVHERTEALWRSEEKYRTLVEASPDGVVVADLKGHVTLVSQRVLQMHGTERVEDMLGRNFLDFIAKDDHHRFLDNLRRTLEEGITRDIEYSMLKVDGTPFPGEISATVLKDGFGQSYALVAVLRDITDRKRAQAALAKEHRNLKHLLHSSDHERQLIAYEIHDGVAQQLAAALMQFQTFEYLKDKKPGLAAKAFAAGTTMLEQSHYETRRLIAGVRPPILDEEGAAAAVGHLVNEQIRLKGPKIEYHSRIHFDRLDPTLENAIYRIAQEALTNACEHSKSERISVSLLQRGERVRIDIRDWGVGFDPKAVPKNHFGLEGIRQRARLLGGKCSIRSAKGKGTRVTVELRVVPKDEEG
jgi:PAS domain S-box-containing protein